MRKNSTQQLFDKLCGYMDKLENKTVDVSEANAMAGLMREANTLLNYELKRAVILANTEVKKEFIELQPMQKSIVSKKE